MGLCYSLDTDTPSCHYENQKVRIECCDKKSRYMNGYQPYYDVSAVPKYYTGKPPPYNPNS